MKRLLVKVNGQIIDQTQGPDADLAEWLKGNEDAGKFPFHWEGDIDNRVLVKDYTVEYIDLTLDYEWLLSEVHRKRREEYPSLGDQMDAMFKARQGDNADLLAIDNKIKAVKAKYPRPVKA